MHNRVHFGGKKPRSQKPSLLIIGAAIVVLLIVGMCLMYLQPENFDYQTCSAYSLREPPREMILWREHCMKYADAFGDERCYAFGACMYSKDYYYGCKVKCL